MNEELLELGFWRAFWISVKSNPEVLRAFIIGSFTVVIFILLMVASKLRLFKNFSLGKTGLSVQAKEKEKEKEFQSGNLEHLVRDNIQKLDAELLEFAMEKAKLLRRSLAIELHQGIKCSAIRKSLSSALRYPLFEASFRNNFKYVLRPENSQYYIERLLKEISYEYEEFAIEHAISYCPNDEDKKCPCIPLWENIKNTLEDKLIEDWANAIRQKNIDICNKKIDVYRNFIKSFEELGDTTKVKVFEHCIDKNRGYIEAFIRKPGLREN
ncbi:MAG: hypothetical protein FWH12_06390 [Treponema sp.]|nr:hypothetical protein [Treponema sp.]